MKLLKITKLCSQINLNEKQELNIASICLRNVHIGYGSVSILSDAKRSNLTRYVVCIVRWRYSMVWVCSHARTHTYTNRKRAREKEQERKRERERVRHRLIVVGKNKRESMTARNYKPNKQKLKKKFHELFFSSTHYYIYIIQCTHRSQSSIS